MHRFIDSLMRLGVVKGMTFRLAHEDGVGMFVVPNPQPTRMQLSVVPASPGRKTLKRASGQWVAKPLHVAWGA